MYCHKYLERDNNHVESDCLNKEKLVVTDWGCTSHALCESYDTNFNNGVGSNVNFHTQVSSSEACLQLCCSTYYHVLHIHKWGPYNNLLDRKVQQFIGLPLLLISPEHKGEPNYNVATVSGSLSGHQESRFPTVLK